MKQKRRDVKGERDDVVRDGSVETGLKRTCGMTMTTLTMMIVILMGWIVDCNDSVSVDLAPPHLISVTPSFGPDAGGTTILIRGRNLAFLDQDVKLFMNTLQIKDVMPHVEIGWESIRAVTPPCPQCGLTTTNVIVGKKRSNALPFLYENECRGPMADKNQRPILAPRWSAEENCTICTELLLVSSATVGDQSSWQQFVDAMGAACESRHFLNFTVPGTSCMTDYNIACKILVRSQGDQLAALMWKYWETNYFSGKAIDMACAEVGRCDYSW